MLNQLQQLPATQLPGHQWSWLQSVREQAFAQFIQQGVPTLRVEDWKYTNLHRINNQDYASVLPEIKRITPVSLPVFSNILRLVFVDGILNTPASEYSTVTGIKYQSFASAVQQQDAILSTYLQQAISAPSSAFPALNVSMAMDGAVIEIAENAQVDIIELVYYTSKRAERTLIQPRNLIVCGAHSKATIVEHYTGEAGALSLTNSVTEVQLGVGAQLHHIKLQAEAANTDHIGQLFVTQQQNSHLQSLLLSLGGNLVRNEIQTLFAGEHSQTELYGLFLAQQSQHMDQYTLIDHAASYCTSQELYRGILLDNARGVFNGRVVVRKDAHKTSAKQTNNNLLLSPTAEIDTKPELQIYNDDLQCSHAATVGQLDKQALFYLQARGLSLAAAKNILLGAFAQEILDKIAEEPLRVLLQQQLFKYLIIE